jgi:fructose-1,6-bisphosphatase I
MIPTTTLGRFILAEERKHRGATGELSDLISAIALGVKYISRLVATSGVSDLSGYTGKVNVQGEATKILDEQSDEILVELLSSSGHFGLLVSEERDTVVGTTVNRDSAKYVVAFDPLDGSSNLGSNIPVGTIFTIFRKLDPGGPAGAQDFLQSGRGIVAAGYAVYGAKTTFVFSSGSGVHGFTLDPAIGEFVLTEPELRSPARGKTYSVNEGNSAQWAIDVSEFIAALKVPNKETGTPYSLRYAGSLVADFDRNLKNGGIFLYPADVKNPRGKLRLLYECMPLAFIAEQAGAMATDGQRAVLDITPGDIHERCPLVIGSRHEVEWYLGMRAALKSQHNPG